MSEKEERAKETRDYLMDWARSLKYEECFPHSLKIYAPTPCGMGVGGDCTPVVDRLIEEVNSITGESTVYAAVGWWYNPEKGEAEGEPVKVIEVGHCMDPGKAQRLAFAITKYAVDASQYSFGIKGGDFVITPREELLAGLGPRGFGVRGLKVIQCRPLR